MASHHRKLTASKPAPGVSFYTPAQQPPSGTPLEPDTSNVPTLFQPLTIRGVTIANRFVVSPMCQYSADDGHLTDWHLVSLGTYATHGAALTIAEAAAVQPNGRISPEDAGLWSDSHIAPLRRVADFVHSQGHKVGVQLSHAGRKASTLAPWHAAGTKRHIATQDLGGWPDDVWGPSPVPFADTYPPVKEMGVERIRAAVEAFAAAARRAVDAGVDVIEIHAAHGYLICQFLSPLSNQRTDEYGGSFENRTRFLLEVIRAVRGVIPASMPLFLRISATEWMEWSGKESWDLQQSIALAHMLPDVGVDLLDVSSGGNSHEQKIDAQKPDYQTSLARAIRDSLRSGRNSKLLIGALGLITTAEMARDLVQGPRCGDPEGEDRAVADVVIIARQFMREPEFVLRAAHRLGVKVKWSNQLMRAEWAESQKV